MKTQTRKLLTLATLGAGLILATGPNASFAASDAVLTVQSTPAPNTTIDVNARLQYTLKLSHPQPAGTRVFVKQEFYCDGVLGRGSGLVELDAQGQSTQRALPLRRMGTACGRIGATFKARFRITGGPVKPQMLEARWKVGSALPTPKLTINSIPGAFAKIRSNSMITATIKLEPATQTNLRTMITCYGPYPNGGPTPRYQDISTNANGVFVMRFVPINLGCNLVGKKVQLTAYPNNAGSMQIKPAVIEWTIGSTPF